MVEFQEKKIGRPVATILYLVHPINRTADAL